MRVGIRSVFSAGNICIALLLGVMPVATVTSNDEVALGQYGAEAETQAPTFTAIDLHPTGWAYSYATGISGDEQAGDVWVPYFQTGTVHAALWRGNAASMVKLHPNGFEQSRAWATSGAQQVGYGWTTSGNKHALLWRGSAASVVDLHPRGFTGSEADGTSGEEQVGFGAPQGSHPIDRSDGGSLATHALLWRGSAASVVDLHPRGFISSKALATSGGEQAGSGLPQGAPLVGSRQIPASHALLWRGSATAWWTCMHFFLQVL